MPTGDFPPPEGMIWTDVAGWVIARPWRFQMQGEDKTKLLEDELKKIIEDAKRGASMEDLSKIAREALEKIGVKD